jgi:hypothetical protein
MVTMNPVVEKLADQAEDYVNTTVKRSRGLWCNQSIITLRREQFVKLILKECRTALKPMLQDTASRKQATKIINQYFGINGKR